MTITGTTFMEKPKTFHETLETVTIEHWLLHGLDAEIGATGECQGRFVQVKYFKLEGGERKQYLWRTGIEVVRELKTGTVTIEVEDNLFKITAEKAVYEYWRDLPDKVITKSLEEYMKYPDAKMFFE